MNAYKVTASIPKNRKISLDVPADVPVGPVEIIFIYQTGKKNVNMDIIEKSCGSLQGSRFNSEKYMMLKKEEKELER